MPRDSFSRNILFVALANCALAATVRAQAYTERGASHALSVASKSSEAGDWWPSILRNAGIVEGGILLTSRALPGPGPKIAVTARNIGLASFRVSIAGRPRAFVSDNSGNAPSFPRLTQLGESVVGARSCPIGVGSGNTIDETIEPGETRGCLVNLSDYYHLEKSQSLAVIAMWELHFPNGYRYIASKPINLTVRAGEATAEGSDAPVKNPLNGSGTNHLGDQSSRGGATLRDFCLEVLPQSAPDGKIYAVASLICLKQDSDATHPTAVSRGWNASDYDVVTRDWGGRSLLRVDQATNVLPRNAPRYRSPRQMRFGDGVGTILPLAQWFDLRKAGKYTVRVTLRAAEADKEPWLAQTFSINVPAQPGKSIR